MGKALSFNGTNNYIDITGFTDAGTTHTFECWVKATNNNNLQAIMDAQTGGLIVAWGADLGNQVGFFDGLWKYFGNIPTTGVWLHLAFRFNASTSKATVLVNGELYGLEVDYTAKAIGGAVRIGSRYDSTSVFFGGLMADFRIWNTYRTQAEIKANMYHRLIGTETGLTGYWKMNEGTGPTAYNSVSGVTNGTITGATWVEGVPILDSNALFGMNF